MIDFSAHIEYDTIITRYTSAGQKIESNCNEITFINQSGVPNDLDQPYADLFSIGSTVLINGVYLLPPAMTINVVGFSDNVKQVYNNSLTLRGNIFEIDRTQYDLQFQQKRGDSEKGVLVIRKIYKYPDRVKKILEGLLSK